MLVPVVSWAWVREARAATLGRAGGELPVDVTAVDVTAVDRSKAVVNQALADLEDATVLLRLGRSLARTSPPAARACGRVRILQPGQNVRGRCGVMWVRAARQPSELGQETAMKFIGLHPATPPRSRRGIAAAIATTVITAAALSACGAATNAPSPSITPARPPASSSGNASPSTATTGSGSRAPAATSPAGLTHCTAAQLRYRLDGGQGAAGTINVDVRVTNVSSGSCWTYGYPGLQILDPGGHQLPTVTLRGPTSPFQSPLPARVFDQPQRVLLPSGGWGWFDLAYNDVPQVGVCPSGPARGAGLAIIAPDTTTAATISLNTMACGGRLGVSPILPASARTQ